LKLFKIPNSLASRYAVARTVYLCGEKPAAQTMWICAAIFMVLSSVLETTLQSSWEMEQ